jgi:hypothetical protein
LAVDATSVAPLLSLSAKRSEPPERRTRWKERFDTIVASNNCPSAMLLHAPLPRYQNDTLPLAPMLASTSSAVSTAAMVLDVLAGTSNARQI